MSEIAHKLAPRNGSGVAFGVGAGGLLALVLGWIVDSKLLRLFGLIAAATGGSLYARQKVAERSDKIEKAQTQIRSELDELDPIGRAQVLEGLVDPDH